MIDILLIALLLGSIALGWYRGFLLGSIVGIAMLLGGMVAVLFALAFGKPPAAIAFLLGGFLSAIPVAIRSQVFVEEATESLEGVIQYINRAGGSFLAVIMASCSIWFIGAVASVVPNDSPLLNSIRSSSMMTALIEQVPPNGTLGALILRSGLIPGLNGPLILASEPDPNVVNFPRVLAARDSVLEVSGVACNSKVTGTAWVAGPGLMLTNAHVVAGQQQTFVSTGPDDKSLVPVMVTAFDVRNDVAVLTASGVQLPPAIPLGSTIRHNQSAAVIGFPKGGVMRVTPARIDRVSKWPTEPVGGGASEPVNVLAFRAEVQQGNSGGPIVDENGSAIGLVVAKGLGQRIEAAYGVAADDLQPILLEGSRRNQVSTGRCLEASDEISGEGVPNSRSNN